MTSEIHGKKAERLCNICSNYRLPRNSMVENYPMVSCPSVFPLCCLETGCPNQLQYVIYLRNLASTGENCNLSMTKMLKLQLLVLTCKA